MIRIGNNKMESVFHVPVMVGEVLQFLKIKNGSTVIDCTFGEGGHTRKILEKIGEKGKVLAIDRDREFVKLNKSKFSHWKNLLMIEGTFGNVFEIAAENGLKNVDGILFDLGVSTWQLEEIDRGISFRKEQALDMRMGDGSLTAATVLNEWDEENLKKIFSQYADIKNASVVVRAIVKRRRRAKFLTTDDLHDLLVGLSIYQKERRLLARVWQAIRMVVNDEMAELEKGLEGAVKLLKGNGRLVVLSYHSVEDRLVKNFFKEMSRSCKCPKEFPECVCLNKNQLKIITKKPLIPSKKEQLINIRSHSAKMRVAEKI